MSYKQITQDERYLIQHHLRQGLSATAIARILNRHRSTISREVERNVHGNGSYIDRIAQSHANGRRSRSRRQPQFTPAQWAIVVRLIRMKWSPEQIALVLRLRAILWISHQTIYRYLRQDRRAGGDLYKHLRQSGKRRRKSYRSSDSRGVLRGKRDITERPPAAERRLERGHFEVDLVHGPGSKECILTLVDRCTRLLVICKLLDKTMAEVNRVLLIMIRRLGILTLTADNGSEFHDYARLERLTGVIFYFAKPYHAWERGTSENTNGLIRQYLPKHASMAGLTQHECNAIARQLNTRPRKILNLSTPLEAHYGVPSPLLHFKC